MRATTDQANRITSLTEKLDEAQADVERLNRELSESKANQLQLTDGISSLKRKSKTSLEELKNELKTELSTTQGKVESLRS